MTDLNRIRTCIAAFYAERGIPVSVEEWDDERAIVRTTDGSEPFRQQGSKAPYWFSTSWDLVVLDSCNGGGS